MVGSEIIRTLPGSLEWMVLFDLSTVRRLVAGETVRAMFFLPSEMDLDSSSHVVLLSQGTLVALRDEPKLLDPAGETVYAAGQTEASLYGRFSDRFDLFPGDDVDCLGFGETLSFPPVLLHLRAENGYGAAKALFVEEPSEQHYQLLTAIGVEYLGGSWDGPYFVARFQNHLPTHLHAGILAHFSRTSHCNRFFMWHGSINERLEDGLIKAATSRVSWAAEQTRGAVLRLANEAVGEKELALTCQPPSPAETYVCGDVVPLGFVLGDRTLLLAQLRLLDFVERDGAFPPGTPFCSAREPEAGEAIAVTGAGGGPCEVSLYFDSQGAISTSAAALALLAEGSPVADEWAGQMSRRRGEAHPRYRCRDHAEYVRRFAIQPSVNDASRVS